VGALSWGPDNNEIVCNDKGNINIFLFPNNAVFAVYRASLPFVEVFIDLL
jgi:hypothetical protein